MNRQLLRKVYKVIVSFLIVGCLFLCSCGLEQFYELDPPVLISQNGDSPDASERVCIFKTADSENARHTELDVYGTFIFYKIYGDLDTMNTQVTSINNSNTEHTENGFNRLKNLQFKQMNPIIPAGTNDKTVTIRLYSESSFKASVSYTESGVSGTVRLAPPNRETFSDKAGFTFTENSKPLETDWDVEKVSPDTTRWYVPLFAVVNGRSPSSPSLYSELEYLGYVIINQQ